MARLIYSAISSLDGYITDADGAFDWTEPDEQVHTFVNDLNRPVGTYLFCTDAACTTRWPAEHTASLGQASLATTAVIRPGRCVGRSAWCGRRPPRRPAAPGGRGGRAAETASRTPPGSRRSRPWWGSSRRVVVAACLAGRGGMSLRPSGPAGSDGAGRQRVSSSPSARALLAAGRCRMSDPFDAGGVRPSRSRSRWSEVAGGVVACLDSGEAFQVGAVIGA